MRERIGRLAAYSLVLSRRFATHRGSLSAGGLAFFVALSIAPAAVVVGGIAGLFVTPEEVRSTLTAAIGSAPNVTQAADPFIDSIVSLVERSSGSAVTITSIVSLVIAVYAASRMVYGFRLALNTAFGVPGRYQGILERLLSSAITLVGIIGAVGVILVLTIVPKILSALGITNVRLFTGIGWVDWLIVALAVWLGVWWLIRSGPDGIGRVPMLSWGPLVAAVWIMGSSAGVGVYVSLSGTLGAAIIVFGSALVVLMWLYLCFVGLLFGAEIEAERQERARV
ncbi:MAG: hypothetical protein F2840_06010 [Actinobacteria bacterium]|jgi:membrane protein|uniref:Unannotated protein n=1 Tax=freshwater metagenome TaxID=449393 RepID=A0A6J7JNS6_9ZZZZ|nr:hypothetical protein [Actinomycetota bacterium]